MRICIINEFFYPDNTGGTGTVLADLAQNLLVVDPNLEIDVLTSRTLYRSEGQTPPTRECWDGIDILRLNTPAPMTASTVKRLAANSVFALAVLWQLLLRKRYDALIVTTAPPPAPFAAQVIRLLKRTPYAYVTYDLEPDRAAALKVLPVTHPVARILRRLQRGWLRSSDEVVALGRCMKATLHSRYGIPLEKISVIPIGHDATRVTPVESTSTEFRKKHGLRGFVALYSGNFGRYHNFDTILDAAKRMAVTHPDMTVVLVGNGSQRPRIAARIETEAIGNVRLFPFVPREEFSDLQASADVSLVTLEPGMEGLCVPSKFYNILAAGRPTLAIVGPQAEVSLTVEEEKCGIRVDPEDVDGLVDALSAMIESPDELNRMGRNARIALENHYSNALVARQYYGVIKKMTLRHSLRRANAESGRAAVRHGEAATAEAVSQSKSRAMRNKAD